MVSASKAKRLAKKAGGGSSSTSSNNSTVTSSKQQNDDLVKATSKLSLNNKATNSAKGDALAQELEIHKAMTCTGVLSSLPTSRDVRIENFTLSSLGKLLITETSLELTFGRRYGLLGENGCGKSTFLKSLAARQVPIPEHIDIYLLNEPAPKTTMTALNFVLEEARKEIQRLEDLADDILSNDGPESTLLQDIYDRLDAMDPSTFESRVSSILWGLGFDGPKMTTHTQDMSGGWRMRVALAKALFIS
ncbi:hypothetical protein HMI56_004811 [Coelomomyces lativittatus]|nr:hypothetical protein HMI56_004811 [Coelomomyces lativittatus]